MIVGLIFKIDQPFLLLPIDRHRHHNAAGVDLVRLLLIGKLSLGFEFLHGHQGQIHQADILPLFAGIQTLPIP